MITAPAGVMSQLRHSVTLLIRDLIVNVKFKMLKTCEQLTQEMTVSLCCNDIDDIHTGHGILLGCVYLVYKQNLVS